MGKKLWIAPPGYKGSEHREYGFTCPGCKCDHSYVTQRDASYPGPVWEFNGNLESPTFKPSLLVNGNPKYLNPTTPRCHLFLTDGVIDFLSDCAHEFAGKKYPLPDLE